MGLNPNEAKRASGNFSIRTEEQTKVQTGKQRSKKNRKGLACLLPQ